MLLILVSSVILTGCSTNAGKYDHEAKADFTKLKTYDWFVVPESMQVNKLVVSDVRDAVNKELSTKGIRKVSENPSFLIALHISKELKRDYQGFSGTRYGSYRMRLSQVYEEGTMILDFVDPETKKLLWRGSSTTAIKPALTPEEQKKMITEVVSKILDKFPPA
jgi:hypothetical protein